ncbi:hypothetical protein FRC01_013977, partial [Tulasnella sp. 417]
MVRRLSSVWLVLGLIAFPVTINAVCLSGVLCGINTIASSHKRFWGTCVHNSVTNGQGSPYNLLALNFAEFGMVTPIKVFEMSTIRPTYGSFDFRIPDNFVSYWKSRAQASLWIHTLLPTTGLPAWLTGSSWTKAQMSTIIQDYVFNVAAKYRGQIYAWNVVSEIFNDDGTWRRNTFYNYLSSEYVQIALQRARSADPNAKLYIEEYGVEVANVKSDALFNLAQDLKNKNVPLDGIAFEGHFNTPDIPYPVPMMTNAQRFENLDLDWAFTQLGVRIVNGGSNLIRQAEDYYSVLIACM